MTEKRIYKYLSLCMLLAYTAQASVSDTELNDKLRTFGLIENRNNMRPWTIAKDALNDLCKELPCQTVTKPVLNAWQENYKSSVKSVRDTLVTMFKKYPTLNSYPDILTKATISLNINTTDWVQGVKMGITPDQDLTELLFTAWFLKNTKLSPLISINKEKWNTKRKEWNEKSTEDKHCFLENILPDDLMSVVTEHTLPIKN